MNSARTLQGSKSALLLDHLKVGGGMGNSLELDLHSSGRLDDTGGNYKDNCKSKTEEDNPYAGESRPGCNGSTPQGDSHEIEDSIPPLRNYNS